MLANCGGGFFPIFSYHLNDRSRMEPLSRDFNNGFSFEVSRDCHRCAFARKSPATNTPITFHWLGFTTREIKYQLIYSMIIASAHTQIIAPMAFW